MIAGIGTRLFPPSAKHGPAWARGHERPWVLGHRGARKAAPENTLKAFDLAMDEGADGVELDVRLDGDGRVVVMHDATFERTSSGSDTRRVGDLGRAEIDTIDVGDGERVPDLASVLRWARERDARVNVELKRDSARVGRLARAVADVVESAPASSDRIIFSSFDSKLVFEMARRVPSLPTGWLVHENQRVAKHTPFATLLGAAAIHPQAKLVTARRMARWKADGRPVNVWTVNDEAEARRLRSLGVDAIISDRPGAILRALRSG